MVGPGDLLARQFVKGSSQALGNLPASPDLATRLPEYARPLFVRLCSRIATTGTFKPQKQALAREGFDPRTIADPLYVWDRGSECFLPLDRERLSMIERGEMRF